MELVTMVFWALIRENDDKKSLIPQTLIKWQSSGKYL